MIPPADGWGHQSLLVWTGQYCNFNKIQFILLLGVVFFFLSRVYACHIFLNRIFFLMIICKLLICFFLISHFFPSWKTLFFCLSLGRHPVGRGRTLAVGEGEMSRADGHTPTGTGSCWAHIAQASLSRVLGLVGGGLSSLPPADRATTFTCLFPVRVEKTSKQRG